MSEGEPDDFYPEPNDFYLKWLGSLDDAETLQAEIIRLRSVLQAVINNVNRRSPNDFIAEVLFSQAVLDTIPDESLLESFELHPLLRGRAGGSRIFFDMNPED